MEKFLELWSGVILLVVADEKSIEPDYSQHKKELQFNSLQRILLILAGIILVGISIFQNHIYQNLGFSLLLMLNLLGMYIGYLLIQKQVHIHSSVANHICSLFAQSDCNNVLNSPVAKFLGVVGWSELGFGYFVSNVFVLLFTPDLLPYLVFLNIIVLPYSFWSIWYQKFKAKVWCVLCLIVQLLFWLLFIISFVFGLIQMPNFNFLDILFVGLIYGVPLLLIHSLLPYQVIERKLVDITQKFNSLRMNDKVFRGLLKEQFYYGFDKNVSKIIFGNPNARNIITVFSNPHCEPCAIMHRKIEILLNDSNNQCCIQYILSSFDEKLNSSCEFFLYVNKMYSEEERNNIYSEWFDKGKYDKENMF